MNLSGLNSLPTGTQVALAGLQVLVYLKEGHGAQWLLHMKARDALEHCDLLCEHACYYYNFAEL